MSKSHYTEDQRKELVTKLMSEYGKKVTKETILSHCEKNNLPNPHFIVSRKDIRVGKDYDLELFYEN